MPAPKHNTNAQKGDINRQMFTARLPVDVIAIIKEASNTLELSQSDFLCLAIREYNKSVERTKLRRA